MKNLFIEKLLEEFYLCEESIWRPRNIRNLSESSQKVLADKTVTSLFRDIKSNAFNLDFSDVEIGKGDVTKIHGYKELNNAISYLKKLSMNVKNPELINAITQIDMAHNNLLSNKSQMVTGFKMGNNLVIYLFNSLCVSLIQATSFVVSQSVEIVKDNMNTYHCELKNIKTLKNANISALTRFNEMTKSGKLNTAISNTLRLKEDVIAFGASVVGAIMLALVVIREAIFLYYYTRIKLSAYLSHLKDFVLINASTLSKDQKNIKEKQEKIAKRLGELSDRIAIDQEMASERSKQNINQSNKTMANSNTPENTGELSDILY